MLRAAVDEPVGADGDVVARAVVLTSEHRPDRREARVAIGRGVRCEHAPGGDQTGRDGSTHRSPS